MANAIDDRCNNSASLYSELLSRGLRILINIGQFDMKDGVRQTLLWTKNVEFPEREYFDSQPRRLYTLVDPSDETQAK